MKKQFMVRIIRDSDEDYADVVVDAESEDEAKGIALAEVQNNPEKWFDEPPKPRYLVDPSSDVEDVTDGEYLSVNAEPRP